MLLLMGLRTLGGPMHRRLGGRNAIKIQSGQTGTREWGIDISVICFAGFPRFRGGVAVLNALLNNQDRDFRSLRKSDIRNMPPNVVPGKQHPRASVVK